MRTLFMGTPAFAVPSLEALISSGDPVVAVVCQPDRPAGRGQQLHAPPVKLVAAQHQIPVLQPEKLRAAGVLEALQAYAPDLIVVAAYGKILPPALLSLPPHGCINVHASLLPKYRGAAPIQWAILRGEAVTGVTIMYMNERMDEGDIILQRQTPIGAAETAGELQDRLARLGAAALLEALVALKRGALQRRPQRHDEATLAPMIQKEDGKIDWSQAAADIERRVRAFAPWPSAFTAAGGKLLKIHRATVVSSPPAAAPGTVVSLDGGLVVACGSGALRLDEVQLEGRQRLAGDIFARGARLTPGQRLG